MPFQLSHPVVLLSLSKPACLCFKFALPFMLIHGIEEIALLTE